MKLKTASRVSALLVLLSAIGASLAPRPAFAAPAQATDSGKYRFVVYGDCRTFPDDHRKVVADIVKLHPEFVFISGDLIASGKNTSLWDEYNQVVQPYRDNGINLYTVQGNHDLGSYLPHASKVEGATGNGYYYAFTLHGSRFIVLDNFDATGIGPGTPQGKWFENELAAAQKSAVNTFVTCHVPPFSVGPHGPNAEVKGAMHDLCVKYHVRAVFTGHDHLYYHTTRDGITYIVSGGGGAPIHDAENAATSVPGDVYAAVHNVVLCEVDGTTVKVTAYAVDHDPTSPTPWHVATAKTNGVVTVVKQDGPHDTAIADVPGGGVIDTFTVTK
jgi:hypothetical protein